MKQVFIFSLLLIALSNVIGCSNTENKVAALIDEGERLWKNNQAHRNACLSDFFTTLAACYAQSTG